MSVRRKNRTLDVSAINLDSTAALLASPTLFRRQDTSFSMDTTAASSTLDTTHFLPGEISKFYNQSFLAEAAEPLDLLAQAFFDILDDYVDSGSPFDAITHFHQVCSSFTKRFRESRQVEQWLERWLEEEKNTWQLLETLYKDRLTIQDDEGEDARMELGHSEKEAMLEVFERDSMTRQCQLVVDWLERSEAERKQNSITLRAEHFSEKTVCWENTVHQLHQGNKMTLQSGYTLNLITEADPDAPLRQNRQIHKLDAEDDALLMGQILSLVRCGQLEQAQQLCVHCGQPWRAATLEGWRLFHNPNLDVEGESKVLMPIEGNPNRDLWKLAAWRLAEDKRVPQIMRTTYAALCGHLQAMLPSMLTWSDWLWAHLRAMIDVRIEEEIREHVDKQYLEMPAAYWANKMNVLQIFGILAACPNPRVRAEHAEDFPTVQRALVLDDMDTLYSTLALWARQHKDLPSNKSPLLLRFAAHLVLVLKKLRRETNEICAQHAAEVLKIYTHYVMTLKKPELVISYVAYLPEKEQVDTLALFFEGITDPDLKSHCLVLANNLQLDVQRAVQRVVVAIREKPLSLTANPIVEEEAKVHALDWLVIHPLVGGDALWHANALVRQFVAKGKLELARSAYAKIPQELIDSMIQNSDDFESDELRMPARHKAAIREHLSFIQYLDAHRDFSEWLHFLHKMKPVAPEPISKEATFQQKLLHEEQLKTYKTNFDRWQTTLGVLAKASKKRFVNILTFPDGGWLQDKTELEPCPETLAREAEINTLVKLVLPQSAFLLHEISLKSGQPQDSLDLATILASEKYSLYRHFTKNELRELLHKITESSVELLKKKHDSFGFEATS